MKKSSEKVKKSESDYVLVFGFYGAGI